MPRFTFLLVSFALVLVRFAAAQDRALMAEGDYAAERKEGEKILAPYILSGQPAEVETEIQVMFTLSH
jgi:hypothetical protein